MTGSFAGMTLNHASVEDLLDELNINSSAASLQASNLKKELAVEKGEQEINDNTNSRWDEDKEPFTKLTDQPDGEDALDNDLDTAFYDDDSNSAQPLKHTHKPHDHVPSDRHDELTDFEFLDHYDVGRQDHQDEQNDIDHYSDSFHSDVEDESPSPQMMSHATMQILQHSAVSRTSIVTSVIGSRSVERRTSSKSKVAPKSPKSSQSTRKQLSEGRFHMGDLKNEINLLHRELEEIRYENKKLKRDNILQSRQLDRLCNAEAAVPDLINRHNREAKALQSLIRKYRDKSSQARHTIRDLEEKLRRTERKAATLQSVADENRLEQRDKLAKQVAGVGLELEQKSAKLKQLEKHIDHLKKTHQHELELELGKHAVTQQTHSEIQQKLQQLREQLTEKETLLEKFSIFPMRSFPSKRRDSICSLPSLCTTEYSPQPPKSSAPTSAARSVLSKAPVVSETQKCVAAGANVVAERTFVGRTLGSEYGRIPPIDPTAVQGKADRVSNYMPPVVQSTLPRNLPPNRDPIMKIDPMERSLRGEASVTPAARIRAVPKDSSAVEQLDSSFNSRKMALNRVNAQFLTSSSPDLEVIEPLPETPAQESMAVVEELSDQTLPEREGNMLHRPSVLSETRQVNHSGGQQEAQRVELLLSREDSWDAIFRAQEKINAQKGKGSGPTHQDSGPNHPDSGPTQGHQSENRKGSRPHQNLSSSIPFMPDDNSPTSHEGSVGRVIPSNEKKNTAEGHNQASGRFVSHEYTRSYQHTFSIKADDPRAVTDARERSNISKRADLLKELFQNNDDDNNMGRLGGSDILATRSKEPSHPRQYSSLRKPAPVHPAISTNKSSIHDSLDELIL